MYSLGLQVGPGFLSSLRRHGLRLNLLAVAVVLLGVTTALVVHFMGASRRRPSSVSDVTGSDAPSLSYATVSPLTMILCVLSARLLVLDLLR